MMIRRHVPAPRRGLSLLEVLLALAILVLALAAIGQLVDAGTERGNDARYYTRGTRLAQGKMAEIEAGLMPLTSEAEGQFDGDDAAWQYKVTPEPAGPPNLFNVTVRVTRTGGRPLEIVLTQLVFDPTVMGSAAQAERPAADDTGGTTPTTPMGGTTP
ncbi:MAG: prepilin-type N-terminal cleavage/methylation domain-containing protein [Planctomycetes bacterium]|nr:prepilin-type N-terminal cleavage/methylation domain-containing protein [Planctomycetota bacterium]